MEMAYEGYITKNNTVEFAEGEFECDVTQLVPNSHVDEEGYLVDEKGVKYDLTDADVKAEIVLSVLSKRGYSNGEVVKCRLFPFIKSMLTQKLATAS